ncbi:MAG: hypothetical protein JXR50_07585 [Prolixibacteraceae bacterium]|nr:hypothetical protein [Prolixibacteraceae bacterium]MBN2649585.1 hypothetical protein [Prolixibacteraceae bacterium]
MNQYRCKNCGWTGSEQELDFDNIESCAGNDTIEVCPKCGSMDIVSERCEK